jgi:hypothetical protein
MLSGSHVTLRMMLLVRGCHHSVRVPRQLLELSQELFRQVGRVAFVHEPGGFERESMRTRRWRRRLGGQTDTGVAVAD